MTTTEKVLIIGAITALAVVLALARREPPGPGAVGKANPQQQGQGDIVEFLSLREQKEKALA